MKNKFLERAVQGTALDDALRVSQQIMEAKLKMPYATGSKRDIGAGLKSFSKKILSSKQLDKFVKLVHKYEEQTGNISDTSDIDVFVKHYLTNKPKFVNMPGYTDGMKKILKASYTKKEAEALYVQYWTSKIITEHNERVTAAAKLSKRFNETAYGQYIDIRKPVVRDGSIVGQTVDLKNLQKATEHEEKLHLRSKKDTYKLPSSTSDEIRGLIIDSDIHTLSKFSNLKLLFLSNLMVALQKSHWDDAYEIASLLIKHGKLAAVYNSYMKSNIAVVFEYNEGIADGNSDHTLFTDRLVKLVEAYATKDKALRKEAQEMGIIEKKKDEED